MLGSESPVTLTSARPDCLTASATPGTAGAAIPAITLTSGYTLRMVCASAKARSRSPSLGRMTASFTFGYFSAIRVLMYSIHSF